jgi:hypothetical protein
MSINSHNIWLLSLKLRLSLNKQHGNECERHVYMLDNTEIFISQNISGLNSNNISECSLIA